MDAVNLYGGIPVEEAIEAVTEKLNLHLQEIDTFGLATDDKSSSRAMLTFKRI